MIKPLLTILAGMVLVFAGYACADAFSDGMSYGKGQQSTGTNAIKNFKPEETIPGYTANPSETGYYGGVTSPGVDLTSPGMNELNTSESGKAITESILNTPADNKPSLDAPFISAGTNMQDNAETVIDPSFDDCQEQNATFTEITTHQCNRTPAAELYCTRTAGFGGEWKDTVENKYIIISHGQFRFSRSGKQIVFSFNAPQKGMVLGAGMAIKSGYAWLNSGVNFMNSTFNVSLLSGQSGTYPLGGAAMMQLTQGQSVTGTSCSGNGTCIGTVDDHIYNSLVSGSSTFTLTLYMQVAAKEWVPTVVWSESCPFDKSEEVLATSTCTVAGGNKTVVVDGKTYTVYSDCWEYRDVYVSQSADNGTCGAYMNNTACTINGTTCLESLAGICLSETATFSCENKVSGTGMMCGGEFFCTDGSCAQGETGTNNMFAQAVSVLAAVAAAGEDIAEFNEADVRAFTGTGQSCRKAMAGFSNCCKDSGWGNDAGLASCSSEEKALGKAKEKLLTVKIGTYCAHKVLGVCLEKKESYCQFDSKLAQIVQEQGRKGQLGVNFGSTSSPNCRGITIDELQAINFDTLNFANFYSDLNDGTTIPEDSELLEKAKQMIADKVAEAGK